MSDQRHEFCVLASHPGSNLAELCRRYKVSRKTAYKWISRFRQGGREGLSDRSRRPKRSPGRIEASLERQVVQLRQQHPWWGGRKLRRRLQTQGQADTPAASTIQQILRRNDLLETHRPTPGPFVRFERPAPNDLWQIDYKGHFAIGSGRCHPLTVLDDHSRFCVGLQACGNEQAGTVRAVLERLFAAYGLPAGILCDNGSPWGDDAFSQDTLLTVWLLRLGVDVCHGRPYHPQTQGKVERLHRTMEVELIGSRYFADLPHFQRSADRWREDYNCIRPHEALDLQTPATRYRPSPRPYPGILPPIQYDAHDHVRKVDVGGWISFRGRDHKIGRAFAAQPIALRPTTIDGVLGVYYCHHKIKELDLRTGND